MPETTDLVIVLRVASPSDARLAEIRTRIKTLLANNTDFTLEDFQFLRRIQNAADL